MIKLLVDNPLLLLFLIAAVSRFPEVTGIEPDSPQFDTTLRLPLE